MNNLRGQRALETWVKILLIGLFVTAAGFFALNFDIASFQALLEKHEKAGLLISLLVYVLLGVTPIPSEALTLLVLAWKGPAAAILLATTGNTLAALVEFAVGESIGDLTDFEKKKERLPFGLSRLPIQHPVFLLLARMLPGYGAKFVSIASGVYQVPMRTYLWTTAVANLVGAVMVVLAGMGLFEMFLK